MSQLQLLKSKIENLKILLPLVWAPQGPLMSLKNAKSPQISRASLKMTSVRLYERVNMDT
jgi:hypothetical protein